MVSVVGLSGWLAARLGGEEDGAEAEKQRSREALKKTGWNRKSLKVCMDF